MLSPTGVPFQFSISSTGRSLTDHTRLPFGCCVHMSPSSYLAILAQGCTYVGLVLHLANAQQLSDLFNMT